MTIMTESATNTLEDSFPIAYGKLKALFGSIEGSTADCLNNVYKKCEEAWDRNLARLKGKKVKYVLIGEAAPWPRNDTVKYFYATFDKGENGKPITWIRGIWKAFFGDESPSDNVDRSLLGLAEKNFLLVDSLPFAMDYSLIDRNGLPYKTLVKSCLPYFFSKFQDDRISWSNDVRIAFAFKLNGKALIEALPNGITLSSGQHISFDENMIAATGSGLPTQESLVQKWCLQ
jgi:hypothetical protein